MREFPSSPSPINQLHVTNWYPNTFQPHEAPFIREHFRALPDTGQRELWHVQVRNEGSRLRLHSGSYSECEHFLLLDTPIKNWRLLELLHLGLLAQLRGKLGSRWWDVVNVHIAYPLLRFPKLFRRLFGNEVVITEHWSAFHSGFNLEKGSPGRERIARIFRQGTPVISVSEALLKDIEAFSDHAAFPGYVVPNVVDQELFHPPASEMCHEHPVFLMVGNWAPIKRPLLVFEAFLSLLESVPEAKLRVVGYGSQWGAMRAWVEEKGLSRQIQLLGPMEKRQIADELRRADALLHASDYETFSVVCAEAASCGTPVVASNVGGIKEFIDTTNGFLVENTESAWKTSLQQIVELKDDFDRNAISLASKNRFSPEVVGPTLRDVLARHSRERHA